MARGRRIHGHVSDNEAPVRGVGEPGSDLAGSGLPRPASRAMTIAADRSETCSLVKTLDTWLRTVLRLIISSWAMVALPLPTATISSTSRSRSVREGNATVVDPAPSEPADRVNPVVVDAMAELGLDVSKEFPKPLTDDGVRAADVVITMGCGDACPIFPGKRYEDWALDDPAGHGPRRGAAHPRRHRRAGAPPPRRALSPTGSPAPWPRRGCGCLRGRSPARPAARRPC